MNGYTGTRDETEGIAITDEAPPMDWESKIANAGRILAAGLPSNPNPATVTASWNSLRAAAKLSAEQIEEMARALAEFQDATDSKPAIYTNRAARRARAKAERSK